jgi:hypothetical protein
MSTHTGSCHCGKVAFEFESGPLTDGLECNCSICGRKGTILHFVPASSFTLKTPREALTTYTFNKHAIAHHFCATCGVSAFGEGVDPKGNAMAAINLRCVEGVDPRALQITFYNGRDA